MTEQMQSPSSALYLFDDTAQTATLHLVYENGQVTLPVQGILPNRSKPYRVKLDDPDWAAHLTQRQPYLLKVSESPVFTAMKRTYLSQLGVQAVLVIPLLLGDRPIGSFSIRLTEIRDVQPIELELAQALAHQVTLALQLTQLVEQSRQAAVLDERNRMAQEIHDTLAQGFTGIVVHLEGAKIVLTSDPQKRNHA